MTMGSVGVIGGGQLAWMMAMEAPALGIALMVQTPQADDPAVGRSADWIPAAIDDVAGSQRLARLCDVVTFENEFVDLPALQRLANQGICFRPSLTALAPLLDKHDQRCFLRRHGIAVPEFELLHGSDQLEALGEEQFPLVLKACRHGYDGQGTFIVQHWDQLREIWDRLGQAPALLEQFVPFERELAVMVARSAGGEVVVYPVVETQQTDQVCRAVIAPAPIAPTIADQAQDIARRIVSDLDYVGILGIEFFLTAGGDLWVNELAPRTHNSGHYTLDACTTSQFAMHLQAITDRPLGDPAMKSRSAVMVNLLGFETADSDYPEKRQALAALPRTKVHWYGKSASRPGRKLGHVTQLIESGDPQVLQESINGIERLWYG